MAQEKALHLRLVDLETAHVLDFPFDEHPSYAAVSHVWSHNLFPVALKDSIAESIGIQRLESQKERTRYLWIDTWCINQNDDTDKAQQIQRMDDIYRGASFVYVMLENDVQTEHDMYEDLACILRDAIVASMSGSAADPSNTEDLRNILRFMLLQLLELVRTEWLDRVWTAQEYILGKNIVWICTNGSTLELDSKYFAVICLVWEQMSKLQRPDQSCTFGLNEAGLNRLEHFFLLNKLRDGDISHIYGILLSYWRNCSLPQDEIYGMMAATNVALFPDYGKHLDELWPLWFEKSLAAGYLIWLVAPRRYEINISFPTSEILNNCIMPEYQFRFDALRSVKNEFKKDFHLEGPVLVADGSVGVFGRVAGLVKIDEYLGCISFGSCDGLGLEIGAAAKGRPDVARRILNALRSEDSDCSKHKVAADEICRVLPILKDKSTNFENIQGIETATECTSALRLESVRSHQRTYLGTLISDEQKCDVIIMVQHDDNGDFEFHEQMIGEDDCFQALDINAVTKQEDNGVSARALIIVHRPDRSWGLSSARPLHKVGVTYDVLTTNETPAPDGTENPNIYRIHSPPGRVWLGGRHCLGCRVSRRTHSEPGSIESEFEFRKVICEGRTRMQGVRKDRSGRFAYLLVPKGDEIRYHLALGVPGSVWEDWTDVDNLPEHTGTDLMGHLLVEQEWGELVRPTYETFLVKLPTSK